jgi:hypothetical protein
LAKVARHGQKTAIRVDLGLIPSFWGILRIGYLYVMTSERKLVDQSRIPHVDAAGSITPCGSI